MGGSTENARANSLLISFWGKVYISLTVLLGAGILSLSLLHWQPAHWMRFGIFLLCAVLACSLKVSLPGIAGARSVNYLFILIGVIMLDLPQVLIVGLACTLVQCLWKPEQRPNRYTCCLTSRVPLRRLPAATWSITRRGCAASTAAYLRCCLPPPLRISWPTPFPPRE
jgi:hypothetical protein